MEFDTGNGGDKPRIRSLNGTNYRQWAVQVGLLLKAQGLWTIVETKTTRKDSESIDAMKSLGRDAPMKDAKASSIIMGLCGQSALAHILIIDGAYAQWAKLKNIYAPMGLDQLDAKMMEFTNYQAHSDTTIAEIATKLDTMQNEIALIAIEEKPTERMKRSILYRTVRQLDAQYDSIILQLSLSEQKDYEAIVTQLTEYERRLAADATPVNENVFSAQAQRNG